MHVNGLQWSENRNAISHACYLATVLLCSCSAWTCEPVLLFMCLSILCHHCFCFFSLPFSTDCANSYNRIYANQRRGRNRISWLYPRGEESPRQKVWFCSINVLTPPSPSQSCLHIYTRLGQGDPCLRCSKKKLSSHVEMIFTPCVMSTQ